MNDMVIIWKDNFARYSNADLLEEEKWVKKLIEEGKNDKDSVKNQIAMLELIQMEKRSRYLF